MKRAGNLYHRIFQYENLLIAFRKAARGKHDRPGVQAFKQDFDKNILKLQDQLIQHEPDIGHYRYFRVFDPKKRSICAASFPERVLHHAVMNVCEPVLEKYAVYDSYACRKEKGNRRALARAVKYAQKFNWYLKLDIRKYFDAIDHEIMMKNLQLRFKDRDLLCFFEKILDTYHSDTGRGIPIGNLISQHLANFYLGIFDHWIKEERNIKGYVRYMDDMLFFDKKKAALKTELELITGYLKQTLNLTVKENIQLNQCCYGIPFLGYRVFPGGLKLSFSSRKRFVQKFRNNERKWGKGFWSMETLARHTEPLIDFTRAANAKGFRKNIINRYGVSP